MSDSLYNPEFFAGHEAGSLSSARVAAPIILSLVPAQRVIDVGCGTGAWLRIFAELGVPDIRGVDGPWVQRERLLIPPDRFTTADVGVPLRAEVGTGFDLACCLEVGEHLSALAAATLVESLTRLAPVIAFSAAIPGQGGTGHINEQWPAYWAALFAARGFRAIDCLRPRLWNEPAVQWWYAQNLIVFASEEGRARHPALRDAAARLGDEPPHPLVHPRCFESRLREPLGMRRLLRDGPGAVGRALAALIGNGRTANGDAA
ncbi:MAG: methyltransferase domain-containing protein [Phycisphaeraceae bacterium]|nr:methyltransferase domain-containing protein [Phycisphaeraceae bacterium]